MSRDFDDVIRSIGMWLGKESSNYFVDALTGRRIDQLAKMCAIGLERMSQAQQRLSDSPSLISSQTYDSNPATAGRRRDGNDGVVEMHTYILCASDPLYSDNMVP